MSSILDKTQNLIQVYRHICGESDVPDVYHFWCCVGMIAAALEDRVWYEIYKHDPIKPNLYIFLVGPGSVGKGVAISQAARLAYETSLTRVYRGKITYAHLIDRLGDKETDDFGTAFISNPRLWLIMDELKNDLGSNKTMHEEFIAMMTELFTATNYPFNTGTRTHGAVDLVNPCVNWLVGSNLPWMRQILTRTVFESGFPARTIFVSAGYDLSKRTGRVRYPDDYDYIRQYVKARLKGLYCYRGRFIMTPRAEASYDKWVEKRAVPEDEQILSVWFRHKTLLLKFGMINCVADGGPMVIQEKHVRKAMQMIKAVETTVSELMVTVNESVESRPVNVIERFICSKKQIDRTTLLRKARSSRGYVKEKVDKVLDALLNEGRIRVETEGRGRTYFWNE